MDTAIQQVLFTLCCHSQSCLPSRAPHHVVETITLAFHVFYIPNLWSWEVGAPKAGRITNFGFHTIATCRFLSLIDTIGCCSTHLRTNGEDDGAWALVFRICCYYLSSNGCWCVRCERSWLEVVVMLDYMQIYKPCMDSPEYVIPPAQPANMIGVFTNEIRVAQDCFIAGLPVWLIWPATEFVDVSIQWIVLLVLPNELLIVEPLSNSNSYIYEGSSNSHEKFDAILQVACHSFCLPYPFNLDAVGPLTSSHPTIQSTTSITNTRRC